MAEQECKYEESTCTQVMYLPHMQRPSLGMTATAPSTPVCMFMVLHLSQCTCYMPSDNFAVWHKAEMSLFRTRLGQQRRCKAMGA